MNIAILTKAREVLAKTVSDTQGIFTDLIETLLPILLDLLGNCFGLGATGQSVLDLARSNKSNDQRNAKVLIERQVRRYLRERHGWFGYYRHNGDQLVEMTLAAAKLKDEGGNFVVTAQDVTDFAMFS